MNPIFGALVFLLFVSCAEEKKQPPLSPQDALLTFHLPEGFRIELVASEPLITDPVEIAFDAEGHLYVAEMEDYPAEGPPGGRIMILEDRDSDGHYESGNVFADSLPYVNGVMPWHEGVLVTSAPHILYLADTNDDGRADVRQVVLSGFAFTNPQLRMSSLRYGLDNWIYGAYSRSGGQRGYPEFIDHGRALRFAQKPRADSTDIYPGTDFRFRPDSFLIQPAGGMSQFGMSFDAEGNRFTVWNNIHLRHVVIDGRYPARNPSLNIRSLMASVSDHGDAATVYSRAQNRLDLHESEIGHFTSACGHSVYTGGLFPAPYDGAAFVCEPVSNIVHVDLLQKRGATFSASRAEEEKEFLSSTDSWFRPVNTTVGPDGGLYVVDFYRKLVEHPAWIARADEKGIYTHAGVLQEKDFLEGSDRGRIYRVVPDDHVYNKKDALGLRDSSCDRLVPLLAHENMWWRINAQRLLVERKDAAAIPLLKKLFRETHAPVAKVHALRTLQGLRALNDEMILEALREENTFVQKQGLLLAESRLTDPSLREAILSLPFAENASLQFQLALTLSFFPGDTSFPHLIRIAEQNVGDEWFHQAVLLSAHGNITGWFKSVGKFVANGEAERKGKLGLLGQVASIAGRRQKASELSPLISYVETWNDTAAQQSALSGMADGLTQGANMLRLSVEAQDALIRMMTSGATGVQSASIDVAEKIRFERWNQLKAKLGVGINAAVDSHDATPIRAQVVRMWGLDPGVPVKKFQAFLSPVYPSAVRAAAARALIRRDDIPVLGLLTETFNSSTPEIRAIIETGFATSAGRMSFFIDRLADGQVDPALLSPAFRSRLLQHPGMHAAERAKKMLTNGALEDRKAVVNKYYVSTIMQGDAAQGKEVFRKTCSACHLMEGVGRAFGPDLLSVSNQTRINLLTMILDPNNNIAPGFDGYLVQTAGGRTFTGILGNETSTGVMLRTAEGREEVIARDAILVLKPLGTSLMPPGLEAGLTTQDIADVLEYLKKGNGEK